MSLFSSWANDKAWDSKITSTLVPTPRTCLNFLITVATCGLELHNHASLGLAQMLVPIAGTGAASIVQIGETVDGKLVAVKSDRQSSRVLARKEVAHFERYLNSLTLEILILTCERVKASPNIIDILGFGMNNFAGEPSCFITEEYSKLGDLRKFFQSGTNISVSQKLSFCLDIAEALHALHSIHICHGDVKLENALVFERDDGQGFLIKLSDFSHATVIDKDDPEGSFMMEFGTPLLRAPEIANGERLGLRSPGISVALSADVFSYGLSLWEIFKLGDSYFEDSWLKHGSSESISHSVEVKEGFLDELSGSALAELGYDFVETCTDLDTDMKRALHGVFSETLHYSPSERCEMAEIIRTLRKSAEKFNKQDFVMTIPRTYSSQGASQLFATKYQQSLFQILGSAYERGLALETFPLEFQRLVVLDLKKLAGTSDTSRLSQSDAAMTISECYVAGFGVDVDMACASHWLHQAALSGSAKAKAWYYRLCNALDLSPSRVEQGSKYEACERELTTIPTEEYLYERILYLEHTAREVAVTDFRSLLLNEVDTEHRCVDLMTFHCLQVDHLNQLHVASWLGQDDIVEKCIRLSAEGSTLSRLGRTPLFYACFGGQLSTLQLLVRFDQKANQRDLLGITPLHLCIFFPQESVEEAVSILLRNGANFTAATGTEIEWEEHDIVLKGTPMEWAVQCRNIRLIKIFLKAGAEVVKGLVVAIQRFFWDVAEFLLPIRVVDHGDLYHLAISSLKRPFGHWIAHGKDHRRCISRTFDALEKHGLRLGGAFAELDNRTLLIKTIVGSKTIDDFEIVRQLAMRSGDVKYACDGSNTALGFALSTSRQKTEWREPIRDLLSYYTVPELEEDYIYQSSYLHTAVVMDSVVGASELLAKGVNVNQLSNDGYRNTPLDLCVMIDKSPELATLLLENGASMERSGGEEALSPLEWRLVDIQRTPAIFDLLLDRQSSREVCVQALHFAFNNAWMTYTGETRKDALETYRYLLSEPRLQGSINDTNDDGVTLLHRTAATLNTYLTTLLLEAGADVRVPSVIEGRDLLPLQVALGNGKFYWDLHASNSPPINGLEEQARKAAFDTTCLLLSEHNDNDDGLFKGITKLHLAAYMGIAHVVEELIRDPSTEVEAKGCWLGIPTMLTPAELLAYALLPRSQEHITYYNIPYQYTHGGESKLLGKGSEAIVNWDGFDRSNASWPDLPDVRDKEGNRRLSPRLIHDNASRVMELLGHDLSNIMVR